MSETTYAPGTPCWVDLSSPDLPATIRFYEGLGLIRPARRSSGNYRLYDRSAGERLTFIGAAQAAGIEVSPPSIVRTAPVM